MGKPRGIRTARKHVKNRRAQVRTKLNNFTAQNAWKASVSIGRPFQPLTEALQENHFPEHILNNGLKLKGQRFSTKTMAKHCLISISCQY